MWLIISPSQVLHYKMANHTGIDFSVVPPNDVGLALSKRNELILLVSLMVGFSKLTTLFPKKSALHLLASIGRIP